MVTNLRLSTLEELTPAEMWTRYESLCASRSDVQATRYILGAREKILQWIHSVGVATDPGLAAFVPKLPPPALRKITAAREDEIFLWTGLADVLTFLALFEKFGNRPNDAAWSVLDFGCGCGRLARFLTPLHAWHVHGCDINPQLVDWCAHNLNDMEPLRNGIAPPLPITESTFDLVYSMSVFTHLDDEAAQNWFSELMRVLKRGGLLIVTTHGTRVLEIIRDSTAHQKMFEIDSRRASDIMANLPQVGYYHQRYAASTLNVANAGVEYGNAFVHPNYVRRHWLTPRCTLLCHVPAGLRHSQDIFVFRSDPAG